MELCQKPSMSYFSLSYSNHIVVTKCYYVITIMYSVFMLMVNVVSLNFCSAVCLYTRMVYH